jgi:hypothetical protein
VLPDGIISGVGINVGVDVEVDVGTRVGVGKACSVKAMATETVSATIVDRIPVSVVGASAGAEAVGRPGKAQATMVAKKVNAMKNVRLLFMVFFLIV